MTNFRLWDMPPAGSSLLPGWSQTSESATTVATPRGRLPSTSARPAPLELSLRTFRWESKKTTGNTAIFVTSAMALLEATATEITWKTTTATPALSDVWLKAVATLLSSSTRLLLKTVMEGGRSGGPEISWQRITNYCVVTEQGLRPENTSDATWVKSRPTPLWPPPPSATRSWTPSSTSWNTLNSFTVRRSPTSSPSPCTTPSLPMLISSSRMPLNSWSFCLKRNGTTRSISIRSSWRRTPSWSADRELHICSVIRSQWLSQFHLPYSWVSFQKCFIPQNYKTQSVNSQLH